jgi:hypothetical protein
MKSAIGSVGASVRLMVSATNRAGDHPNSAGRLPILGIARQRTRLPALTASSWCQRPSGDSISRSGDGSENTVALSTGPLGKPMPA